MPLPAQLLASDIPHLPAEDIARRLEGHNVGVGCEHLVQHRAAELSLHVFVEAKGHNVLDGKGSTADRVFVKLADVGQDVGDLVCRTVSCAGLWEGHAS